MRKWRKNTKKKQQQQQQTQGEMNPIAQLRSVD